MLVRCAFVALVLVAPTFSVAVAGSADSKPDEQRPLALVNGEAIPLGALIRELEFVHGQVKQSDAAPPRQDVGALLQRMIDTRLIVQQGIEMGLEELPEVTSGLQVFQREALRTLLFERAGREISEPDPARVDALYEEKAREYLVSSLVFAIEPEACAFEARVRAGEDFEVLAPERVERGVARTGPEPGFLPGAQFPPEILAVVRALAPGETSAPVRVEGGFALLRLDQTRMPDNPELRKQAEAQALRQRRAERAAAYAREIRDRFARIDRKLLESLDYESAVPGFDALAADRRVLAELSEGAPITVQDLSERLARRFFHGPERAAQKGKPINASKEPTLDAMLLERTVFFEARRLGLEQEPTYREMVDEEKGRLVFDRFLRKVVDPEIKVDDTAIAAFLASNAGRYTLPEMMRIDAVVFRERAAAAAALERLEAGAEWAWVKANASGQADPARDRVGLRFDGSLVTTSSLPETVHQAVAGATAGSFRICSEADGPYYLLRIREVVPARRRTVAEVKGEIEPEVYADIGNRRVDEWLARLRAGSEVKVLVKPAELEELVRRSTGIGK